MVRPLLIVALLAGSACAPREVPVQVEIVTETCSGTSPMEDVTHFQFRVFGEGIDPVIEQLVLANNRAATVPQVPAGRDRQVEVRAYAGEPSAAGRMVSRGVSHAFDVPEVVPLPGQGPRELTIFLRPVDDVTGPSLAVAPGSCTRLSEARAGHTATRLADGKVLIAGGYQLVGGVRVALADTELFDPRTGVFAAGPPMGASNSEGDFTPYPRAHHAAVVMPDGKVLITGGESYDAAGTPVRHASALLFDPTREQNAYGAFTLRAARAHHAVAVDTSGRALIVGGINSAGGLVPELEWWGGASSRTELADQNLARVGMSVTALPDGAIAIAGGTVSGFVTELVQFFVFDETLGTFTSNRLPALLDQARRDAPVVPFSAPDKLVALGGFGDTDDVAPSVLGSSEVIETSDPPVVVEGPAVTPRGAMCAVPLGDGRVLTLGGRGLDEFASPVGSPAVEVMTPTSTGAGAVLGLPPLPVGRYQHTCTLLPDGAVLVLGGLSEDFTGSEVLDDAWIVTPRPRD